VLTSSWGETAVVAHGTAYRADALPALLAEQDGGIVGLLTYVLSNDGLEIVTLDALLQHSGIGTALLNAATDTARRAGAERLWLVTTNDNLDALRFYQRRELRIVGIAPNAVVSARARKPSIPLVGEYGIPLHDELTLELRW
jgi:ribosomal protein S18 acetylase RimI-like enzyme